VQARADAALPPPYANTHDDAMQRMLRGTPNRDSSTSTIADGRGRDRGSRGGGNCNCSSGDDGGLSGDSLHGGSGIDGVTTAAAHCRLPASAAAVATGLDLQAVALALEARNMRRVKELLGHVGSLQVMP